MAQSNDAVWRCGSCKSVLGKIAGNTVIVKYKKQLIKIPEGSRVTVTCRKCHTSNSIYASKLLRALKDGVFSHIKTSDGQELCIKLKYCSEDIKIDFDDEHP